MILLGFAALVACTNNTTKTDIKDDIRVLMNDSVDARGVQRMQLSDVEQTITLKGNNYRSRVRRVSDDALPHVKNEAGEVFADNTITLRIVRIDGGQVFQKTFTKQDFSILVGADFLKNAILEGMVFDTISAAGMVYAVSVSYPQTDLYIPISVTITPDGKMSMEKDERMEDEY